LNLRWKKMVKIPTFNFNKPKVSVKHTKNFHKKKNMIPKVILSQTEKHEIIYGEQAVKKQVPKYLHRPTQDFDIYTPTPLEDARETEKALDKRFGGDYFKTIPGKNPGTFRVVANANNESYADYTQPKEKVPYKNIDGKKYATLGYMLKKSNQIINDPMSSYRHNKDMDTINRIKITKNKGGK